ncbi:MAG: cold-shock protein [Proteobacteria bacterium]|nr:cold-shock protein [Pseudomonadota bacterium]
MEPGPARGTVKWFSKQKRFGFIEQDNGSDIFVHISQVKQSGLRSLFQGERLEFKVSKNEKGAYASGLKKL